VLVYTVLLCRVSGMLCSTVLSSALRSSGPLCLAGLPSRLTHAAVLADILSSATRLDGDISSVAPWSYAGELLAPSINSTSNPAYPEQRHILYHPPTLCSFLGIGSGQRQLIAVTCIAEHA